MILQQMAALFFLSVTLVVCGGVYHKVTKQAAQLEEDFRAATRASLQGKAYRGQVLLDYPLKKLSYEK